MTITEVTDEMDMRAVYALRMMVFVVEQQIQPVEEWDNLDDEARHLLMRDDDGPVATLRWRVVEGDMAKVERVCVARRGRGTGLGAQLMDRVLADIRATPGLRRVTLGAQVSATGFYEAFGFVPEGGIYDDAGIPHQEMVLGL